MSVKKIIGIEGNKERLDKATDLLHKISDKVWEECREYAAKAAKEKIIEGADRKEASECYNRAFKERHKQLFNAIERKIYEYIQHR